MDEEMNIVTLVDEETGEEMEFALVDGFDYKDKSYSVLVTATDNEEEAEMVIMEEVEGENGEILLASIDEEIEDEIYDYYDQLCDEYFDDEDESEEA
ncbi:Protein of unknown function [Oscillospiraceae bacterium]|nr:DUF1292 domain-containing protein [Saccharofermentans sp.]SMC46229.1 Protein of unknown function [Oscillospiraceae bacterium]